MSVGAVEVLAEAAGRRKGEEMVAHINAVRIAGADQKSYKEAIGAITRGR